MRSVYGGGKLTTGRHVRADKLDSFECATTKWPKRSVRLSQTDGAVAHRLVGLWVPVVKYDIKQKRKNTKCRFFLSHLILKYDVIVWLILHN